MPTTHRTCVGWRSVRSNVNAMPTPSPALVTRSSLRRNMGDDATSMSAIAVLEEIDALPATQRRARVGDGNRQRNSGKRRLDVCGHVVGALRIVRDPPHPRRIGRRDQPAKELLEIAANCEIVILLNAQRTGRMLNE